MSKYGKLLCISFSEFEPHNMLKHMLVMIRKFSNVNMNQAKCTVKCVYVS